MNKIRLTYSILLVILLAFTSCTGTRILAEDEYLARNGAVMLENNEKLENRSQLRMELLKMAEVNQNTKLLWMRMRLSIHNSVKEPEKEKGFKYWLKYKLGKPPVIFQQNRVDRTIKAMQNHLFHNSFFRATVEYEIDESKHQKKPVYHVYTGTSFKLDSLKYINYNHQIDNNINRTIKNYKWHNEPYSLDFLKDKRQDVSFDILNDGYFYFRPDYLEYLADTNKLPAKVSLSMQIRNNTPKEAFKQFRINEVVIEDNFKLDSVIARDTQIVGDVVYMSPKFYIKPVVVANAVHLYSDSLYSRVAHMKTLNHLRSLGVYKFVNIIYEQDDSLSEYLNSRLILVPLSKLSLSGELNANVKSNNFAGPGVILSFTNRNAFKSAEILSLNFSGRFETQRGQSIEGNTSYEVRADANLRMPRLYPLKSRRIQSQNIPVTNINIGGALQERINWYQMVNWNTTLRYSWRSTDKISQRFSPLDINLSSLLKTTKEFDNYLQQNPSVKRSFEEQFIIGMNYDFYYSLSPDRLNTPFFFSLTVDMSGNFVSLLNQVSGNNFLSSEIVQTGADGENKVQYKIFNTPYSQYVRSIIDVRKSFSLWQKHNVATRLILAGGYPYGNSTVMPYIKQFYVGGANSLRGFQARSVGPGIYNDTTGVNYVDQTGDLKIETNIEYRFPVWGKLNGALFTDMGNIWLINKDDTREGADLNAETIQFAVSSGIGFRFNFNPIIIRFDLAWPMRYPYKYEDTNSHWVANKVFSDYEWRKENVILNISLGYPF